MFRDKKFLNATNIYHKFSNNTLLQILLNEFSTHFRLFLVCDKLKLKKTEWDVYPIHSLVAL